MPPPLSRGGNRESLLGQRPARRAQCAADAGCRNPALSSGSETERLHIKIKGAHHAGEYLFAQRHPDRARAGLHLRPRCAGSVSELFHPEYRGSVHRRLLHPWLRCRLSGGADRPPLPRPAGGDGGRCVLRFHHSLFADPPRRREHHGRHHRQHRPLHHQPRRDGLLVHHVAGQDRYRLLHRQERPELHGRRV